VSTGGPPHALPSKAYESHLTRPGQELTYDEGDLIVDEFEEEVEKGLVRLAHFQPKRTHQVGMDENGNVLDWVGVWGHKETT